MNDEILNGCLGDGYKETDFILCEGNSDNLPILKEKDTKRFYYNQGNQTWSKKSCTIFGAGGGLADMTNYPISLDEMKEVDDESYNRGRTKDSGWYVGFAVDLWREWWNSNTKLVNQYGKVASYYIDMEDDMTVGKVITKNYNIITGYYGNAKYNNDYRADCVLDGTSFGQQTYGHCNNIIYEDKKVKVKDNYHGTKYNIYELKHMPSEITCWHKGGYIFTLVKDENYEELKKQETMRAKVKLAIETNSELRHLTTDTNYQKILNEMNNSNRKKLKTIEEIIAKLS